MRSAVPGSVLPCSGTSPPFSPELEIVELLFLVDEIRDTDHGVTERPNLETCRAPPAP